MIETMSNESRLLLLLLLLLLLIIIIIIIIQNNGAGKIQDVVKGRQRRRKRGRYGKDAVKMQTKKIVTTMIEFICISFYDALSVTKTI
jgi:hypothetical protein